MNCWGKNHLKTKNQLEKNLQWTCQDNVLVIKTVLVTGAQNQHKPWKSLEV